MLRLFFVVFVLVLVVNDCRKSFSPERVVLAKSESIQQGYCAFGRSHSISPWSAISAVRKPVNTQKPTAMCGQCTFFARTVLLDAGCVAPPRDDDANDTEDDEDDAACFCEHASYLCTPTHPTGATRRWLQLVAAFQASPGTASADVCVSVTDKHESKPHILHEIIPPRPPNLQQGRLVSCQGELHQTLQWLCQFMCCTQRTLAIQCAG
jgi:hypothetical protein